jgi:Methyltransferase domain
MGSLDSGRASVTEMRLLSQAVNDSSPTSLSHRLRARRFARFERAMASLPRPLRIVDIGGTTEFWRQRAWAGRKDVHITLVNLRPSEQEFDNVVPTVGNATALDFGDREFDVAFSNSVIEHLFTWDAQQSMADEVRRVAVAYWIQTPNYWFPMEPHFLTPGWQWLPERTRISILQRRPVGQMGRCHEYSEAAERVREVRLMRRGELLRLFPEATLVAERIGGLVKSWTAVGNLPV